MEEEKKGGQSSKVKCHTLVMGCCKDGKCSLPQGSCGCSKESSCCCPPDAACKRGDVRVTPKLGGNEWLYTVGIIVLASAIIATYFMTKTKEVEEE